jgi:hypothetical protein
MCVDADQIHVFEMDTTTGSFERVREGEETNVEDDDVAVATFTADLQGLAIEDMSLNAEQQIIRTLRQVAGGRLCETPPALCEVTGCFTTEPTTGSLTPGDDTLMASLDEVTQIPFVDVFITDVHSLRTERVGRRSLNSDAAAGKSIRVEYAVVTDVAYKEAVLVNLGARETGLESDSLVAEVLARSLGVNLAVRSQVLSSSVASKDLAAVVTQAAAFNAGCINAPKCEPLKRLSCTVTVNTCGPCLAGFAGDAGDSNAPCSETGGDSGLGEGEIAGVAIGAIVGVAVVVSALVGYNIRTGETGTRRASLPFKMDNPMTMKNSAKPDSVEDGIGDSNL